MTNRYVVTMIVLILVLVSGCTMQRRAKTARTPLITIDVTVLFAFDKHVLKESAKPILDEVAAKLKRNPRMFVVLEGHTDKIGPAAYNEVLAEKRVRAVGAYLIQEGVRHDRATFISMGERTPKDTKNTRAAHRKNRRVEIYDR